MSLRSIISYLLLPLTGWYAIGVCVRNKLYDCGLKKQYHPDILTIGVGNLSAGGTGKTPHVDYLLRLLTPTYRTAMLSRGYRRQSHGLQFDDGCHSPALLGDEPAMIAAMHEQVRVAVCKQRKEGLQALMANDPELQVVVMDDVYQHRAVRADINILLTEYEHPFFKDHILPFGNLREPRSGKHRADMVIVTKCPPTLSHEEQSAYTQALNLRTNQPVFFSTLRYGNLLTLRGEPSALTLEELQHVLLLTGIAHPAPMLREVGLHCTYTHLSFADHHAFSPRDIELIQQQYHRANARAVITTQKDAVRLHSLPPSIPIYVLPIQVQMLDETGFNSYITTLIKAKLNKNVTRG